MKEPERGRDFGIPRIQVVSVRVGLLWLAGLATLALAARASSVPPDAPRPLTPANDPGPPPTPVPDLQYRQIEAGFSEKLQFERDELRVLTDLDPSRYRAFVLPTSPRPLRIEVVSYTSFEGRVSVGGGGQPKWRADGKELFYAAADSQLMMVEVREGRAGPDVSLPTALFELEVMINLVSDDYGVSADGQRFLVKVPPEDASSERIHVVTNWTSLLQ